eukprot:Nk52_evm13s287 gene=Nk52_evmTU13s287
MVLTRSNQSGAVPKRKVSDEDATSKAEYSSLNSEKISPLKRRLTLVGESTLITEVDTNLSLCVFMQRLQGDFELGEVQKLIKEKIVDSQKRFRSKVVVEDTVISKGLKDGGRYYFQETPVDLNAHITEKYGDGTDEGFKKIVNNMINHPFDYSRPLWEMILVHDVPESMGSDKMGCAILGRVHHCIGDGMSLGALFLRLSDQYESKIGELEAFKLKTANDARIAYENKTFAEKVKFNVKNSLVFMLMMLIGLIVNFIGTLFVTGKIFFLLFTPLFPTPWKPAVLDGRKRVAWETQIDLAEVKRISKRYKGTINDVMQAAIAGAYRNIVINDDFDKDMGFTEEEKERFLSKELRVAVPVNLRAGGEIIEDTRNIFGFVLAYQPVHIEDPVKRIQFVKKSMDRIKATPEKTIGAIATKVLAYIWLPLSVKVWFMRLMMSRTHTVCTNVPGPNFELSIDGRAAEEPLGFVPPPPGVAIGCAIMSYNGKLYLTVSCDSATHINPETVIKYVKEDLNALSKLA